MVFGLVVFLVCLSALFSGSETAFTASSYPHMHHMAKKGNRRALLLKELYQKKENLIGALLLGNNAVNTLASALMTGLMISFFGSAGVLYATVFMTVLLLIFAEILPKTYALNHADRSALRLAPLMYLMTLVFSPITNAIQRLVLFLLKRLNITASKTQTHSETILRGAIDLHQGDTAEERAMLQSILDLNKVTVHEVMTHRKHMEMIDINISNEHLLNIIQSTPFSRLPVWEGESDNIIGILHIKSFLRHLSEFVSLESVRDILAKPWFIPETTLLSDQLQAFRKRHEHFAVVIDEYGSLMGIVTLEDILEEIVGNIFDEEDINLTTDIREEPGGTFIIQGSVTIRELNRQYNWGFPDDKATTLPGLLIHESRDIPRVGQVLSYNGFQFEILGKQKNQITSLRLIPPSKE